MSVKNRKRRLQSVQPIPSENPPRRFGWLFPFALGSIVTGLIVFGVTLSATTESSAVVDNQPIAGAGTRSYPTLGELTEMSADELRSHDIALMNLRCAEGLPGAEKLDIPKSLSILDKWARQVRFETERHLYRVKDPQYAEHYRNSEAYFRASMMLQVLQEDCGVHYNHERIRDIDFTKSQDLFIHGMTDSDNGGTCVSMPVLYTAVGRRLGYPIKLVLAKAHVFCRWDGPQDRFNIEGSGEGFSVFEDDYYMKWPQPIAQAEVQAGLYLKSLTSREEMAVFLAARGHCLEDNGRLNECYIAYSLANHLAPAHPEYGSFLTAAVGKRHDARMMAEAASRAHLRQIRQIGDHYGAQVQQRQNAVYSPTSGTRSNPGMGWAQASQPYDVFKPNIPSTGLPNPVADPGFGFPQ